MRTTLSLGGIKCLLNPLLFHSPLPPTKVTTSLKLVFMCFMWICSVHGQAIELEPWRELMIQQIEKMWASVSVVGQEISVWPYADPLIKRVLKALGPELSSLCEGCGDRVLKGLGRGLPSHLHTALTVNHHGGHHRLALHPPAPRAGLLPYRSPISADCVCRVSNFM